MNSHSDKDIIVSINNVSIFTGEVFDFIRVYYIKGFETIESKLFIVYKRQSDNLFISFSLHQAFYFRVKGRELPLANWENFDFQKEIEKINGNYEEYFSERAADKMNFVDSFIVIKGNEDNEKHHPNLEINQPILGFGLEWMQSSIDKAEQERLERIRNAKGWDEYRRKEILNEEKKNNFDLKALELRTNILEYVNSRKSSGFFGLKTILEKKVYQLGDCGPSNFEGEINWDLSNKEIFNYRVRYNREGGGIQVFRLGDLLRFWVKDNFDNKTTVLYDYLSPVFENVTRFNRGNLWMHLIPAQFTIVSVEHIKDERGNVIYSPYSYKKFHERKEELKALNLPYSFSDIISDSEFKKNLSGTPLMPANYGTYHSAKIEVCVIIQQLFDTPLFLD